MNPLAQHDRPVRIRLVSDMALLYRVLGGSAVHFDRRRQGFRKAVEHDAGFYTVVVAKGTKYQQAVRIPAEAVQIVLSEAKP